MRFVLLPGLDGTAVLLKPFLEVLHREARMATPLAYPPSLQSFSDYVRFVAVALKQIDDDVVLIAESFSGPIAISLLDNPPPNLRAIVLVATFVTPPHGFLLRLSGLVPGWAIRPFAPIVIKMFCANGYNDSGIASDAVDVVRGVPTGLIKHRLRLLAELPSGLEKTLGASLLPLLVLEPTGDRLVPRRASVSTAVRSRAVIRKIAGPHFLLQCCPRECWNDIDAFLEGRKGFA